ncbi:unnamed protein product [Notodromas monacha]|uniref:HMG box domain-containing protein n=1 Tax=Notodromas monacha TaxID=399045 RepID=A0A7R9BP74_9CRUS|nr:unnamed protein product [Notodromas monacha]CAG0919139.1 unnamed protein product [Notodromas monacha]
MPRAAAAGHADKPKGRTTAYAFFMKLMSEEQRKKNQSVAFTELTKMCSERWKNMSESEKHKFQVMANEDKVRYDNEMMGYVPGPTDTKTSSKRKKKDPNAPKRAMYRILDDWLNGYKGSLSLRQPAFKDDDYL